MQLHNSSKANINYYFMRSLIVEKHKNRIYVYMRQMCVVCVLQSLHTNKKKKKRSKRNDTPHRSKLKTPIGHLCNCNGYEDRVIWCEIRKKKTCLLLSLLNKSRNSLFYCFSDYNLLFTNVYYLWSQLFYIYSYMPQIIISDILFLFFFQYSYTLYYIGRYSTYTFIYFV